MKRALLLNANWVPLHFVPDWRAVKLLMNERADVVYDFTTGNACLWDDAFTSPGPTLAAPLKNFYVPATLRLRRYVNKRWKEPRFRKRVLFNRDGWQCQYCGKRLNWNSIEVEHVVPRSRGGKTTWANCVAACKPCNSRKDSMTPDEAGMPLRKKPMSPTPMHFWDNSLSDSWHSSWETWLQRSTLT